MAISMYAYGVFAKNYNSWFGKQGEKQYRKEITPYEQDSILMR